MPRNVGVIVVAAGKGSRFGTELPKQYHTIHGIPVLHWAIRPFLKHAEIAHVVVVLPAADVTNPPSWLAALRSPELTFAVGGAQRTDSVRAGLAQLNEQCETVLVHDGARPVLTGDLVNRIIAEVRKGTAVVPAIPITETIKRVDDAFRVAETVPRAMLYRAQTPQGFPRHILTQALATKHGSTEATDEAMLVEAIGEPVQIIAGDPHNIKVTVRDDLELVQWKLTTS